jgi:hypothetical protein
MKTVKILSGDHTSLIAGAYEWLLIDGTEMLAMHFTRTEARNDKVNRGVGSVIKVSEVEFQIIKSEKVSHPHGYETHGFDNCPHCNIHLNNGVLQNGDEVGSRGDEILHLEKFEYYCMACGQEFGPALQVAKVKEKKAIRGPIAHESTVNNPCKLVWGIATDMKEANPLVKRGAVLEECVRQGVAYYTARTQYQSWLSIQKEMAAREASQAKTK